MYESPILLYTKKLQHKWEGDILTVMRDYDISVDKDELIRALRYDRDQYRKGYADGSEDRAGKIQAEIAKEIFDLIEDECLAYPIQEGHPTILVDARSYAELKNKYTGES